MLPSASPWACATFAPTRGPAGSSRSAATCRPCPATGRRRPPSTWTSTSVERPSDSSNGHRPLIRAEGIWKIFGRNADRVVGTPDADLPRAELREKTGCVAAVRDVSFDVYPGEVFVVMGLSGSGKSTLVRTLIRLIEPTAGRIEVDGRDVTAATRDDLLQLRRHTFSMVFQHFGLLAHRTVLDNV